MHVVEVPGVVPYVGTWIEITLLKRKRIVIGVVPYVGTWIEIWKRLRKNTGQKVVPYVGTWIEISDVPGPARADTRRSLRGNVDRNCKLSVSGFVYL